jgi:hypothetical protein
VDTCGRDRRTARQGPGDGGWADNTQRGARAPKQAWDACSLGRRGWCGEGPDVEAAGTPCGGRARVGAARWSAVRGVTGWFKTALHMFDRRLLKNFQQNCKNFEYQSCRASIGEHFS